MLIGRVIGDITATQKHPSHEGKKILLVQPLNLDGTERGVPVVALDSVNAGMNDRVLVALDGFAAFTAVGLKLAPIDAAILAVVDSVDYLDESTGSELTPAAPKKQPKKNRS